MDIWLEPGWALTLTLGEHTGIFICTLKICQWYSRPQSSLPVPIIPTDKPYRCYLLFPVCVFQFVFPSFGFRVFVSSCCFPVSVLQFWFSSCTFTFFCFPVSVFGFRFLVFVFRFLFSCCCFPVVGFQLLFPVFFHRRLFDAGLGVFSFTRKSTLPRITTNYS